MTEMDRITIVENMFPEWREHLNDGKVIENVLEGLSFQQIVHNRCSRPGCKNVARHLRRTCLKCAAQAAQYVRTRRKATNAKRAALVNASIPISNFVTSTNTQLLM